MSRPIAVLCALVAFAALLWCAGSWAEDGAPAAAARSGGPTPAQMKAGRAVMEKAQYSCFTCHSLGGKGGLVNEPALDQVGNHRDAVWLLTWLRDPKSIKPNTAMPKFAFSEKDLQTLVPFLASLKKDIPAEQIFAAAHTPAEAGKGLYAAYDCQACHRIGKAGHTHGPDLSKVGVVRTPAKLDAWIRTPQTVKPGTFMPAFALPDSQAAALVAYLSSLK